MSICTDAKKTSDLHVDVGGRFFLASTVLALTAAYTRKSRLPDGVFIAVAIFVIVRISVGIVAVFTDEFRRDCSVAALAEERSDPGMAPMIVLITGIGFALVALAALGSNMWLPTSQRYKDLAADQLGLIASK